MDQVVQLAWDFWDVLAAMAPYLLLGFAVAGVLSVLISPRLVERHLGGHGFWPIFKAAIFGVPLPLCSCGVIPVSASLRQHGASKGATVSFLISTPETGVDSIAATYSLLGGVFAIFRPLGALISGVMGGMMVSAFGQREAHTGWDAAKAAPADDCGDACCAAPAPKTGLASKFRQALTYGFVDLPRDIGKSLFVGLVVAALITAFVPHDFFRQQMGGFFGHGIGSMLLMMAVGIPMYVCATASVPMAMALMMKGVSPGAALVFLMTGPATNAATIAMIWKVMGRRTTLIYLLSIATCALGMGFLLDWLVGSWSLPMPTMMHHDHEMAGPGPLHWAAAVVLLGVLAYATLRRGKKLDAVTESVLMTETFDIQGMTCSHCASTVQRALVEVAGVESAQVDLAGGKAVVQGEALDRGALTQAVERLGYRAQ